MGGIDLQLLGIGEDGHIGFNEPDDYFVKSTHVVDLDPTTIAANARFFDSPSDVPRKAITMGMVSIMQAKRILLVASGEKEKGYSRKSIFGSHNSRIPASILQLHEDITVILQQTFRGLIVRSEKYKMIIKNARLKYGTADIKQKTDNNGIGSFSGSETVDACGKRVIPGLIDRHIHGFGGFDA